MSWRRAGFISERLIEVIIPLFVFGMLAALVLHLIDLRSVFLAGGEGKLRQATLAFAAAVVLLERLLYLEGRKNTRPYQWAVGITMTCFALYYTDKFRLPAPFIVVFAVTEALFAVLWWAAHHLSAACSVSDEKTIDRAAESGILPHSGILRAVRLRLGLRPRGAGVAQASCLQARDAKSRQDACATSGDRWAEKLSARHPGRVLLYFSLFAIPVFGLGPILFDPAQISMLRLGFTFFFYLWCSLALLFLSSLRQLGLYFSRRELSLPDLIGLPWLALGFLGVTAALALAFLLPQPPSPASAPVRAQIVASYKGWESQYGAKDASRGAQETGRGKKENWSKDNIKEFEKRYENIDKMNDPGLSEMARDREFESREIVALSAAVRDTIVDVFRFLLRVVLALAGVSAVVVLIITLVVFIKRLRDGADGLIDRAKKWVIRDGKKRPAPAVRRFPSFADPFNDPARRADSAALVRYLWEAFLAYCADAGSPCAASQTPLEFVDGRPPALAGFERQARFIARLFTFSEFSSQAIPEATLPDLQRFWFELQSHAARR